MSWAVGYDPNWKRDIGYGVPSVCDFPTCNTQIDRGIGYVCGGDVQGGEWGCGLYFCESHLQYNKVPGTERDIVRVCERCGHNLEIGDHPHAYLKPFEMKPDTLGWVKWKLYHASWKTWREDNPDEVRRMLTRVGKTAG